MSEYLSKEEIRKWRSSLERITLEEYAARLGKIIQEEKHDDSLVDSVMLRSLNSMTSDKYVPKAEKIQSLSLKSFHREKEIKSKKNSQELNTNVNIKEEVKQIEETRVLDIKKQLEKSNENSVENKKIEEIKNIDKKPLKKQVKAEKTKTEEKEPAIEYSFSKALTSREQTVFDHFLANKNTIVYAKDLAKILELPRDYVYKYIKNLRAKLNEDILKNADNGGYVLKV